MKDKIIITAQKNLHSNIVGLDTNTSELALIKNARFTF